MYDSKILQDKHKMAQYTAAEKELLKTYFAYPGGCIQKPLSDEEYYSKVKAKQKSLNLYQRALKKVGVDEDELKEIPAIEIVGFVEKGTGVTGGPSGRYTNKYETTWLLFSDKQMYIYSYTFDMLSTTTKEYCEEYFYKDVTNVTTLEDNIELNLTTYTGCTKNQIKNVKSTKIVSSLKIVVPGESFVCSIDPNGNPNLESKIKAVKAKLREKKDS